jgi:hypothetical protein
MTPKDKPFLTSDFIVRKDSISQQVKPPSEAVQASRTVTSLRLQATDNEFLRELGHRLRLTKTDLIDEAIGLLRERYKSI